MDAPQSELFRRMPPKVQRAAVKAAIAARRPESGLDATFEFEGRRYRAVPLDEVRIDGESSPSESGTSAEA
ncbi:hypothetical protein [Neolewinella sp.]|uniref:hypothetical protein n=1 Tax=Neolewinella sp. TaxID=2993543 RepID=UPI003B524DFA